MTNYPLYRFLIRHLEQMKTYENADIINKILDDKKELQKLGKEWVKNIDIKNDNFIDIEEFLMKRVERYGKC